MKQDEEFLAEDNEDKEKSVLTKHERPRKMVQNWGLHSLGQGMETERFPWYFHRPIFTQLWHNFYLGVGKEGKFIFPVQTHFMRSLQLKHRDTRKLTRKGLLTT